MNKIFKRMNYTIIFQDNTVYVSQDGGLQFHSIVVPLGSVVGCQC